MTSSLRSLLKKIVRKGRLQITGVDGRSEIFGDGSGPMIALRFTDAEAEAQLYADPQLKLAELYMDGRMRAEAGDIYELLALIKTNTL